MYEGVPAEASVVVVLSACLAIPKSVKSYLSTPINYYISRLNIAMDNTMNVRIT